MQIPGRPGPLKGVVHGHSLTSKLGAMIRHPMAHGPENPSIAWHVPIRFTSSCAPVETRGTHGEWADSDADPTSRRPAWCGEALQARPTARPGPPAVHRSEILDIDPVTSPVDQSD